MVQFRAYANHVGFVPNSRGSKGAANLRLQLNQMSQTILILFKRFHKKKSLSWQANRRSKSSQYINTNQFSRNYKFLSATSWGDHSDQFLSNFKFSWWRSKWKCQDQKIVMDLLKTSKFKSRTQLRNKNLSVQRKDNLIIWNCWVQKKCNQFVGLGWMWMYMHWHFNRREQMCHCGQRNKCTSLRYCMAKLIHLFIEYSVWW